MTNKLIDNILKSKKYKNLNPVLIDLIVTKNQKYPKNLQEKATKNLLHQIYGMFFEKLPNYSKLEEFFAHKKLTIEEVKYLLNFHKSTKERQSFVKDFYNQIFTEIPDSTNILDIGCGFNLLNLLTLNYSFNYLGFDIDSQEMNFLNKIANKINLKVNFDLKCLSIQEFLTSNLTKNFNVVFLLKMLPALKLQDPKLLQRLFKTIKTDYWVISFPTKSLGNRKNLQQFYQNWFLDLYLKLDLIILKELNFINELVYICKSKY